MPACHDHVVLTPIPSTPKKACSGLWLCHPAPHRLYTAGCTPSSVTPVTESSFAGWLHA